MTPPKPKMDWTKLWPIGLALAPALVSYGVLQTQVNRAVTDIAEIKRTHALEKDLDRHRSLSAHGSVSRELGELRTENKALERRLRSLERRFFSNGVSRP